MLDAYCRVGSCGVGESVFIALHAGPANAQPSCLLLQCVLMKDKASQRNYCVACEQYCDTATPTSSAPTGMCTVHSYDPPHDNFAYASF